MKVLMFLRTGRYSGAESVACQIIALLGKRIQFVYASPEGEIREVLKEKAISFFPLKRNSWMEYRRAIRTVRPDLIHAHDMAASFLAALSCRRIPLILHIHNNAYDARKVNVKTVLFRYGAGKASHIFWVSDSALGGYVYGRYCRDKSSVLYNVTDWEQIQERAMESQEREPYDIVYVGRLNYPKNPQRMVDVAERIVKEVPDVKIAVIGDGDLREETMERIKRKNLQANVKCLGYQKNPYPFMKRAKALLMTSRWEGMPMTCLEALALGTPVVSTPVDGIVRVVKHGKTGFLSEQDSDLARYCVRLLRDELLQRHMSQAAVRAGKKINDTEKYKNEILKCYERFCPRGILTETGGRDYGESKQ